MQYDDCQYRTPFYIASFFLLPNFSITAFFVLWASRVLPLYCKTSMLRPASYYEAGLSTQFNTKTYMMLLLLLNAWSLLNAGLL
jgi:hypothetical protein